MTDDRSVTRIKTDEWIDLEPSPATLGCYCNWSQTECDWCVAQANARNDDEHDAGCPCCKDSTVMADPRQPGPSIEVIRSGLPPKTPKHKCVLPEAQSLPFGSVIRCIECHRRFKRTNLEGDSSHPIWRRKYLPTRKQESSLTWFGWATIGGSIGFVITKGIQAVVT